MGSVASAQVTGAFLVERGVITPEQLAEALDVQRARGGELEEILAETFGIARELLVPPAADGTARDIGEILLARGMVDAERLAEARERYQETGMPIGPILVEMGAITRLELASALAEQWDALPARILPSPNSRDHGGSSKSDGTTGVAEVDDLRFAMRALEASVRAAKDQPVDDAVLDELRRHEEELAGRITALERAQFELDAPEQLALLGERIAALEQGLVGLAIPEEAAAAAEGTRAEVATLRAELTELGSRLEGAASAEGIQTVLADVSGELDALVVRVNDLARSLEALAARPVGDDSVAERLDVLSRRVDAVAVAAEAASGVDGLQSALEGLGTRLDAVAGVADELARTDALLEELRADVTALVERPVGDPSLEGRVAELAERVGEKVGAGELEAAISDLRAAITDLASRAEEVRGEGAGATARLTDLETRIDELDQASAAGADELRASLGELRDSIEALPTPEPDTELAGRLEALAGRVEALAEASGSAPAELADHLQALGAVQETLRTEIVALTERVVALDEAHAGDRTGDRVDAAVSAIADLASQVEALDGSAATESLRADLEALRTLVEALEGRPSIAEDEVRAWIAETAAAAETRAAELVDRIERLETSSETATGDDGLRVELESLKAVLAEGQETLAGELQHLAESWVAEQTTLRERVDALASTPGGVADGSAVPSSTPTEPELVAMAREIERLGDRVVEQERSLVEHFSRREKAMMERLGMANAGGDLTAKVEQLARIVEEQRQTIDRLTPSAGTSGGASPDELAALKESLFGKIEKLASSLDWRFQRLEGGAPGGSGDNTINAQLAAKVEQLARTVASLSSTAGGSGEAGSEESASFLMLVPTAVGHQLVEVSGTTPSTGDRIISPLGGEELTVQGVGTSPLPGDTRECVFVEPLGAAAAA